MVPITKTARDDTATDSASEPAPTSNRTVPIIVIASGERLRSSTEERAAEPAKTPRINPTIEWLSCRNVAARSEPPTESMSPPSIHVDAMVGVERRNARRAAGGTNTRGRSAARAPGCRRTVSGSSAVAAASSTNAATNTTKTSRVGCGAYWISTPASTAPRPRPPVAAALFTSEPSREPSVGCRSSR